MWIFLLFFCGIGSLISGQKEYDDSRKILGSSVVTSVSVIMDNENGSKASFSDAVGKPIPKPQISKLASPIELLNPDRYEFYTFDESGDLVKRLMTINEIKAIIATSGDDVFNIDNISDIMPEKRVNDIVTNVQNVLKEEMQAHKMPVTNQLFDTPDVSDSWSMILPAIFGNSGEEIKAEKTATASTPETIVLGPTQPEISHKRPTLPPKLKTTTAADPVSLFTKYFVPTKTEAPILVSKSTSAPSTIEKSTTNFLVVKKTTPQKIKTTSDPSAIKVQIFPNSNTNVKEEPYVISTSTAGGEFVRIRTPKPQLPLESRISSSILANTSPPTTKKITEKTTPKTFNKKGTSTPKSNISTRSTTEFTKKQPTTQEIIEKIFSTAAIKPTTWRPESQIYTKKPEVTIEKIISSLNQQGSTTANTKPTEKIYILLRPLNSSPLNTSSTTFVSSTNSYPSKEYNRATSAIFTTITQKPVIVSVASPTTQNVTKVEIATNRINSTGTQPISEYYTSFAPKPSTTKRPENISTIPFSIAEYLKQSTLPTLAELLNKKPQLDVPSTTEFVPSSYPQTKTPTPDVQLFSLSTLAALQNLGSVQENVYSSAKTEEATSTETITETEKTESITTETDLPTTEPVTNNNIVNKEFLEKLLLSSTNVYEINSAVNQKTTYSYETTPVPEELPTTHFDFEKDDNQTLIESFGQLLSQAVGNIGEVVLPENITETKLYAERTTTDYTEKFDTTTILPEISTRIITENDFTTATILKDFTEDKDDQTTVTAEENISLYPVLLENKFDNPSESHLINITIIRNQNQSKPAKVDLRLEADYELLNQNLTKTTELNFESTTGFFTPKEATTLDEETESISENEPTTDLYRKKYDTTLGEIHYTATTSEETSEPTQEYTTLTQNKSPSTVPITRSTSPVSPSSSYFNKVEDTWTLVSTIAPHSKIPVPDKKPTLAPILEPTPTVDLDTKPMQGFGLEESTSTLDSDVYQFVQLCNELAFGFWKTVTTGISTARSVIVSPFSATSLLAMVFLGARGSTSGEMNEILKLDNMVTFNPHLIFKTVSESILTGPDFGVATSAIVRQLYSDRSKESILNFYKERARFFYDGHVEEVSFKEVGDIIRRRTNLLVKKQTHGKIQEFLKDGTVKVRSPLAAVSASVMQIDCTKGSISERDGEIHFVVFPTIKQRRLIPIPAVVYRSGFLAGYEPSLDATAVALGDKDDVISFIFVLPGRQGINALGDGLARLEKRLVESSFQKGAWGRLLRTLIPRPGLEVQIPRFSHRSIINATSALKQMGLRTLFDIKKADLRGLNGVAHDLHLSDMLQFNYFSVCGNTSITDTHHSEYYPATARRSLRKHRRLDHFEQQRILHDDPLYIIDYLSLPLNLRPRQARVPQVPRLRLDRPFLYFVRHNPTGLILHMGRFNPRLLP